MIIKRFFFSFKIKKVLYLPALCSGIAQRCPLSPILESPAATLCFHLPACSLIASCVRACSRSELCVSIDAHSTAWPMPPQLPPHKI